MTLKNRIATFFFCASASIFAQETQAPQAKQDSVVKPEIKVSFLDSIKATFVHDEMASCIDSMWMKELTSLDLYNTMLEDIKNVDIDQPVDYELPTELLKERLRRLDEKSPFNIEYNPGLENIIKSFLKNRKKHFERLMGVSQFYFPIFEEELAKNNIPLEIKYLAIVESALNPLAVSRVGATGLWQFMYQTGKQYGLSITSYVDERSDSMKASRAASQYMKNMYQIFGDWDLVLASYNSGPGNVAKAIRRSGGQQNYWNIRKHLPKETQGYVPAFLATMYIFEYHKEHGITPNKAIANHFATDTIQIKRHMTFKQISDLLDIPVNEISFYNPSYKRKEVPAITGETHYLRLPKDKIALFTSNEEKVYAYVKYEESRREKPFDRLQPQRAKDTSAIAALNRDFITRTRYHKVRRGDNLTEIAAKYDVTVTDIKRWNRLKSDRAPLGRKLKIKMPEEIIVKNVKNEAVKDSTQKAVAVQNNTPEPKYTLTYKTEKVVVNKDVVKYHKVKSGDVLGEIATKYDVSVADLKKWNKLRGTNIGIGDQLKIVKNERVVTTVRKEVKVPVNERSEDIAAQEKAAKIEKMRTTGIKDSTQLVNYYVVAKGDNLFSIAKKNNVTIDNLKAWNNLKDNAVKVGSQLIISGEVAEEAAVETPQKEYRTEEYVVARGDNLGAIAKKYHTTVDQLKAWNGITDNGIQAGMKLVVQKTEINDEDTPSRVASSKSKSKEKLYHVRKGDSLFSISQKFPGVTIADIKRWNNIKGENLRPGMKLKING